MRQWAVIAVARHTKQSWRRRGYRRVGVAHALAARYGADCASWLPRSRSGARCATASSALSSQAWPPQPPSALVRDADTSHQVEGEAQVPAEAHQAEGQAQAHAQAEAQVQAQGQVQALQHEACWQQAAAR